MKLSEAIAAGYKPAALTRSTGYIKKSNRNADPELQIAKGKRSGQLFVEFQGKESWNHWRLYLIPPFGGEVVGG